MDSPQEKAVEGVYGHEAMSCLFWKKYYFVLPHVVFFNILTAKWFFPREKSSKIIKNYFVEVLVVGIV